MGLPVKGKLVRSNTVLMCMRLRIHGYIAAPLIYVDTSKLKFNVGLLWQKTAF
jgi:hypothetical protein